MSALRSLKRNVARTRMRAMGFRRVNKRLAANWRDMGASNFVERMKSKYNKEEIANG